LRAFANLALAGCSRAFFVVITIYHDIGFKLRKTFLALGLLALTACSSPLVYKLDIQQGNYITEDMVAKLKVGMTRAQVRFVLGTPMLADTFHRERWDYPYRLFRDGKLVEDKLFTVTFDGDSVTRFEGSVMPPLKGFVASDIGLSPRQQTLEKGRDADIQKIQTDAKKDGADTPKKD
jgi:outer membrane protein assembly factor BamE